MEMSTKSDELTIIVVGASGDLSRKKIFPALFSLYSQDYLPEKIRFVGFARSDFSHEEFRDKIMENLTCRYTPDHSCEKYINSFLDKTFYCCGDYGTTDSYLDLYQLIRETGINHSNNLFYLAIPPAFFSEVSKAAGDSGLVHCSGDDFWSRVVIEKPFGRDRATSDELSDELYKVFSESQLYRIDHYLGKEMVQNLFVLRFANQIFQPLWNNKYIATIDIVWQEEIGTAGRGGYFDSYGVIRDVVQNHLLQILAVTAMEEPASLSAKDIRDSKVQLLKEIDTVEIDDVLLGQYSASEKDGKSYPGYTDDETVSDDSFTPTFARVKLRVNNKRWEGVPFTIRAGKGLEKKCTEIRIRFKAPESNIFCSLGSCPPPNELIFRVQPDEGLHFNIVSKEPGKKLDFVAKDIELSYESAYADRVIPEAYESLILDVINGDKGLFIRNDELETAWDIFTPVLHYIDGNRIEPKKYPFGSNGPI